MGKYLLNNGKVLVGAADLSNYAFSLDTPDEKEQVEVSGFNPTGSREFLPGQRDHTITIGFLQGVGSAEPPPILQPLYEGGSAFVIPVQPHAPAAVGPGDPKFGGPAV